MRQLLPMLIGLAVVALLITLRAADPHPLPMARDLGFDLYQRLKPREARDVPVRVVAIDEASLAALGQWPWPRARLAQLVTRLTELGAAAVALDMVLAEPDRVDPEGDAVLGQALAAAPAILGFAVSAEAAALPQAPKAGIAISGTDPRPALPRLPGTVLPLPDLAVAAAGLGSLSLNAGDSIEVVRGVPMLWTDGAQIFPALSLEALRVAQGESTLVVLGETAAGFVEAVRAGAFTLPLTAGGDLRLHYRLPDPDLFVSAVDILGEAGPAAAERIAGHIVLVGTSASGLLDLHGTSLGYNIPGVAIHAQALEQMLAGQFLERPDWAGGLELAGFALLGLLLSAVVLHLGPLVGLAGGLAAMAAVAGTSWWMFAAEGVLVDAGFPLVGLVLTYLAVLFVRLWITDADKRAIRRAFGYYVAPALLEEIERKHHRLQLGGEMRELTVMFTDVRGFTALSERLAPPQLLALLNTLFGALGAEIIGQRGTIDKFMGDAIMAFWNAPVETPDHARHACLAALRMRATLDRLNAADAFGLGDTPVAIGVGLATGPGLAGNMGLETRFDYSVVGETVNLAARIEDASKQVGYDLVVAAATRAAATDLAFLEAGMLALKGMAERESVHLLLGDEKLASSPAFHRLAEAHERLLAQLRTGAEAADARTACAALAVAVDPRLGGFYARLTDRHGDFAAERDSVA